MLVCKNTNIPSSLISISHAITIGYHASRLKTTQQFLNSSVDDAVELDYVFAAGDACPVQMHVTLVDPISGARRVLRAVMRGKREAQEAYDDAVAGGMTAGIVERVEGSAGLIRLSLGRVQAGWEVLVETESVLESVLEVPKLADGDPGPSLLVRAAIPAGIHRSSFGGTGRFDSFESTARSLCSVHATYVSSMKDFNYVEMTSPSHLAETQVIRDNAGAEHLTTTSNVSMERDFVIQVRLATETPMTGFPGFAHWVVEKQGDLYSHVLSFVPNVSVDEEAVVRLKTELVVVVDRSGSMSGSRMKYTVDALKILLQSLDPESEIAFNIVGFGTGYTTLFSDSSSLLDKASFELGMAEINGMRANYGGTNILSPMVDILKRPLRPGWTRQILLMTDGEDSKTEEIIAAVKKSVSEMPVRVFCFGIGSDINPYLLNELATVSHGRAAFISNAESVHQVVMEQLHYVLQPSVSVSVALPAENTMCQVDDSKSTFVVFNDSVYRKYYISSSAPTKTCEITCHMGGNTWKHCLSFIPSTNMGVGVLSARQRIRFLEDSGPTGPTPNGSAEVLKMSLVFSVLSKSTAFVVIDDASGGDAVPISQMRREVVDTISYSSGTRYPSGSGYQFGSGCQFGSECQSGVGRRHRAIPPLRGGPPSRMRSIPKSFDPEDYVQFDPDEFDDMDGSAAHTEKSSSRPQLMHMSSFGSALDTRGSSSDTLGSSLHDRYSLGSSSDTQDYSDPAPLRSILLLASFEGIWMASVELARLLGLGMALVDIQSKRPALMDLACREASRSDLWMTSVVLAVLQSRYSKESAQWKYIARKAKRALSKAGLAEWISVAKTAFQL